MPRILPNLATLALALILMFLLLLALYTNFLEVILIISNRTVSYYRRYFPVFISIPYCSTVQKK